MAILLRARDIPLEERSAGYADALVVELYSDLYRYYRKTVAALWAKGESDG
jgi:hypothetical protein